MNEKLSLEIQNKIIEHDNIIYLINEEESKAEVIGCKPNLDQIIIPRSINLESKEYIATSISENAFKGSRLNSIQFSPDSKLLVLGINSFSMSSIKSIRIPSSVTIIGERSFFCCSALQQIEIPNDSNLQTIDTNAFVNSAIESITIPSKLIDLKEGWCNCTPNLTRIEVSPQNPRYSCYEDKMIIGKTRIEQSNYDCLEFCIRNIQSITIPNFIEHICSCSFDLCHKLQRIEFQHDSKLKTINKFAFSKTAIETIAIPSSVNSIAEKSFYIFAKIL